MDDYELRIEGTMVDDELRVNMLGFVYYGINVSKIWVH